MTTLVNEYREISRKLEQHHALFYAMWEIGEPTLTESIPTSCIAFNRKGEIVGFHFNPSLWEESDIYKKSFIIAHECLHVVLNHNSRALDTKEAERFNVAADLVVNHMLVNSFGFDRNMVEGQENYCWVDTVFPEEEVPDSESLEFYFNLLGNKAPTQDGEGGESNLPGLVDDHQGMSSEDAAEICGKYEEIFSEEEKESLKPIIEKHFQDDEKENKGRGTSPGGFWTFANVDKDKVKKKRKWETVIKKWAVKYIKRDIVELEQWARRSRRFQFLSEDLMLPTDIEQEENRHEEGKVQVWFFQDTSGSCSGFRDRFFKAAASLPEDRFDIRMFCFDTRVYETTLESRKLYGFGGTSFDILENYVQAIIKKENKKYPEAVFVITDGYGNNVYPEFPNKWHWFLSSKYQRCIPKESNIYKLSDFE